MILIETYGACLARNSSLPTLSDRVTVAGSGIHERAAMQVRDETRAIIEALSSSFAEGGEAMERLYRDRARPYTAALQADVDAIEAVMAGLRAARGIRRGGGGGQDQGGHSPANGFSLEDLGDQLLELSGKEAVALALREADGHALSASDVADRLESLGHRTSRQNVRTQLSRAANPRYGEPSAATADGLWTITDHGREVADGVLQLRGLRAAR